VNEEYGLELGPPPRTELERLERENSRLRLRVDELNSLIGAILKALSKHLSIAVERAEPLRGLASPELWSSNPERVDLETFNLIAISQVINLRNQLLKDVSIIEESKGRRFRMLGNDYAWSIIDGVNHFGNVFVGDFSRYAREINEHLRAFQRKDREQARPIGPRKRRAEIAAAQRAEAVRVAREIIESKPLRRRQSQDAFARSVLGRMKANWTKFTALASSEGTEPDPMMKPLGLTAIKDALGKAKLSP
jgi:hypothetical protein